MEGAAIAQAVGSVLTPAIQTVPGILGYLKSQYGYVKHLNKYFVKLEEKVTFLSDDQRKVKDELSNNQMKMMESLGCKIWHEKVNKTRNEFEILKNKYQQIGGCLCGKIHSQLKLGKQIVEMTAVVVSLIDGICKMTTMVQKPPDPFLKRNASDIRLVPSLLEHLETLQEHLRNVNVKTICIWGPPGVGKTTIMENLHDAVANKIMENLHDAVANQFDFLLWIPENTGGNIKDIQEMLLNQLCPNLKVEVLNNNYERGRKISEVLKSNSYVLFLDGVSSMVNLKEIGIVHSHQKVVFTCRYKDICGQVDEYINVENLSDNDAQKLFWETVGVDLKSNPHYNRIAERIINECGGMPYMLTLIGTNLKPKRNPLLWEDTLFQLRSPSMEPKQELGEVNKLFTLVYGELPSCIKPCVLYWTVFPAGYELHQDYIIECWRAEKFLMHEKLWDARVRGHAILYQLVAKSLLQKGRKMAHYKMFEYFQRAASRIANCIESSCKILVKERERIREEEWAEANRLSLIGLSLLTPPQRPNCCRILTLLLRESNLAELPPSFFGYMCSLQLLDLHHTNIRLLPSSISSLINLNALFLNSCRRLTQLPSEIGDLQKLEILDTRHTAILCLPTEIGELTNLKCLRVSFEEIGGNGNHIDARPGEMISSNIISRLHSLEELIIVILDPTSGRWKDNVENIIGTVADLEELTTLCFYFPELEFFKTFMTKRKSWNGNNTLRGGNSFRSFNILVGKQKTSCLQTDFDFSGCSAEKHLRFSAGEGFPDEVLILLEQARSFELIGHQDAANLSNFGTDKLKGLEACIIEDCTKMKSIIDGNQAGGVAFQHLSKLQIKNLPKLMHIWEGSIQAGSLKYLTNLIVRNCRRIKSLFSKEIVVQLSQLEVLQVEHCKEIQEVIEAGSIFDSASFPKLKNLKLIKCRKLSDICQNVSLAWPSLEKITIKRCWKLNSFPSTFKNTAKLKEIVCAQTWLQQLDWQNDTVTRDRFQRLHRPDY